MTGSAAKREREGEAFDALSRFDSLDTPPEEAFDRVTRIAAPLFRVPIALISFVDDGRRWIKSRIGGEPDELSRALAICEHTGTADGDSVFVSIDTRRDSRLADLPAVRQGGIRFFARAPLIRRDGHRFGALCILDHIPRPDIAEEAGEQLARLAGIVVDELELRAVERRLTRELVSRSLAESRLKLSHDLTEAALAAPDFKTAIRACLSLIAGHIGADCAHACGLAPHATRCELEAEHTAPGLDMEGYFQSIRRFPMREDNSTTADAIFHQRLIAIADLATVDETRYPAVRHALEHGIRGLLIVPFENAGTRFGLTFMFQRPLHDMSQVAETIHGLSGKVRDLLARKRAEEQLRERELTLRQLADRQAAILDALPAHVALLDQNGRIISASRSWVEFAAASGIEPSAPVGLSYFEFCESGTWGEASKTVSEGLAALLDGRRPQVSIDHPCEQGGWRRWYRLMAAPLALDAAAGAVVMHFDVTSNKLAEEALRREKEFSEFLIRSSTEGIVVFDREFRITLWNPGIEAIIGVTADQVLGRHIFSVLPYLVGTVGETAMRATLEGRETSLYDQRYAMRETGREGFYEAYFSPLYSRGREVIGGIGFLRETTERRRIEDALRQSQKMEAVGQLTGGIAHDFNNMLTVIAGNLELLESKLGGEPRLLRLVNSAALAASRAEKLTQQLLTFSRRQQLRSQSIDFNQIVIGMDDLLHRTVGERIAIRKQLAAELWPALADPNQIETALLNLILNARDAMAHGGQIIIETGNVELAAMQGELTPGSYATLAVTDTGHGMSEDVLAHVFEPFFTTKEVGKGTGLGLSQVYGFVKQSAGHIKIETRQGQGTTVRLYLPRAEGAAGAPGTAPMRAQQYRGNESVLVVEDDHGVRDFAVSVLRELGYRVLEAASGDTALGILDASDTIDLLFTDVVMPGEINGADLAKAALERRPALRILFTSGYTTRLVEKEWPASSIEFLRKPYRSIDLAARVRGVLDRAAAAG